MNTKIKDDEVLLHIIDEVAKCGVVGEEDSIIVLTLKIMLRLVKNAQPTSSNILVSDTSGGGKDFLCKGVVNTLLEKDFTYYKATALSEKALNYFQPMYKKKKVSWDGKVFYLEDPIEETIKSQAFKVMASGELETITVKDQKAVQIKIDGKPVFIVTSMKAQIDDEGQRRWDCIRVDTTPQLTSEVLTNTLRRACGLATASKRDDVFCNDLTKLGKYTVLIPWAMELLPAYSQARMIDRTQINKLIDYIKASAILNQHNRQKDRDGCLIAEKEDYELARFAYIHLRNKDGNALNKKEETLLDYLEMKGQPVKLNEITSELKGVSKFWLFNHKDEMVDKGIVSTVTKYDASANKEIEHLEFVGFDVKQDDLPSAEKLLKVKGYLGSRQLYKDINIARKKKGLLPIFRSVL